MALRCQCTQLRCAFPRVIESALVQRIGLTISMPAKPRSLSVTTMQLLAAAIAAMVMSRPLRGRPRDLPSAGSPARQARRFRRTTGGGLRKGLEARRAVHRVGHGACPAGFSSTPRRISGITVTLHLINLDGPMHYLVQRHRNFVISMPSPWVLRVSAAPGPLLARLQGEGLPRTARQWCCSHRSSAILRHLYRNSKPTCQAEGRGLEQGTWATRWNRV